MSVDKIFDDIGKLLQENEEIELKDITIDGEYLEIQGSPGGATKIKFKKE